MAIEKKLLGIKAINEGHKRALLIQVAKPKDQKAFFILTTADEAKTSREGVRYYTFTINLKHE